VKNAARLFTLDNQRCRGNMTRFLGLARNPSLGARGQGGAEERGRG